MDEPCHTWAFPCEDSLEKDYKNKLTCFPVGYLLQRVVLRDLTVCLWTSVKGATCAPVCKQFREEMRYIYMGGDFVCTYLVRYCHLRMCIENRTNNAMACPRLPEEHQEAWVGVAPFLCSALQLIDCKRNFAIIVVGRRCCPFVAVWNSSIRAFYRAMLSWPAGGCG